MDELDLDEDDLELIENEEYMFDDQEDYEAYLEWCEYHRPLEVDFDDPEELDYDEL